MRQVKRKKNKLLPFWSSPFMLREMSHPRSAERKCVMDERRTHKIFPLSRTCVFSLRSVFSSNLPAHPFSGGELREANQSSFLASAACEKPLAETWAWNKADVGHPQDNRSSLKGRKQLGKERLWKKRILLQGTMLLLNSFNKHLTVTERKINTQEVTHSHEMLTC